MPAAECALKEQFDDLEQQHHADSLGMWIFLATEVLFFGGLFMAYIVYRWRYPLIFDTASNHMHVGIGTTNTIVLLVSSFTMAMGVHFAQTGRRWWLVTCLALTAALGSVFLGLKIWEWTLELHEGLFPGAGFRYPEVHANVAQIFTWLYFTMTGLHGLHLSIGVVIVALVTVQAARGVYTPESHPTVEILGLYWHYVDIVWIFLYPLIYLGGRHMHGGG